MKTIVKTSNNISKFLLEDDSEVDLSGVEIHVSGSNSFYISAQMLAPSDVTVHENVTAGDVLVGTSTKITEWIGNKFTFNGTAWGSNSDWVDFQLACIATQECTGKFTPPSKVCNACGETNP